MHTDPAAEQERCVGYWRSTGDPDRAGEASRRAYKSRQASASVGSWEDFFGTIFIDLLNGARGRSRWRRHATLATAKGASRRGRPVEDI